MSLRKIFTRVKENMLENLCTEEVERKIEREVVKVGTQFFYTYLREKKFASLHFG